MGWYKNDNGLNTLVWGGHSPTLEIYLRSVFVVGFVPAFGKNGAKNLCSCSAL